MTVRRLALELAPLAVLIGVTVLTLATSYSTLFAEYPLPNLSPATVADLSLDARSHDLNVFLCIPQVDGDPVDGAVLINSGDQYLNLNLPAEPEQLTSLGFLDPTGMGAEAEGGCEKDKRYKAAIDALIARLAKTQSAKLADAQPRSGQCLFGVLDFVTSTCAQPCSYGFALTCPSPCSVDQLKARQCATPTPRCTLEQLKAGRCPTPTPPCAFQQFRSGHCPTPNAPARPTQSGSPSPATSPTPIDVTEATAVQYPYPVPPDAGHQAVPMAFEWKDAVQRANWSERYLRLDFASPPTCGQAGGSSQCRPPSLNYETPAAIFVFLPHNALPIDAPASVEDLTGPSLGDKMLRATAPADGSSLEIHWLNQDRVNDRDRDILVLGIFLGAVGGVLGGFLFSKPRWVDWAMARWSSKNPNSVPSRPPDGRQDYSDGT